MVFFLGLFGVVFIMSLSVLIVAVTAYLIRIICRNWKEMDHGHRSY